MIGWSVRKKLVVIPLIKVVTAIVAAIVVVTITHGDSKPVDIVHLQNSEATRGTNEISVMSINMAHGRSDGRNQLLQSGTKIEQNVVAIGNLVARENPQIVAMQEADAPSWWSGGFSHVEKVGRLGRMTSVVQGKNIDGLGLHYGAAVVTRLQTSSARQVTFDKNYPTFSKGFVVVTCSWPGDPAFQFDVLSLHLDFASAKVRSRQLAVLTELVNKNPRPMILMGDFNTDMSADLLPKFMAETGLQTWRADDTSIVTFPILGSRIDWIFASSEFQIVKQSLLDDVLSDHRIVAASLVRSPQHTLSQIDKIRKSESL